MFPKFLDIPLGSFSIPINTYGVMVLAGFLSGLAVAGRRARDRGVSPELVSDLSVWLLFGGLVGARIVYVTFYNHGEFDFRLFDLADGGLHPLGGIAGFAAGAAWWWTSGRGGESRRDAPGRVSTSPPSRENAARPWPLFRVAGTVLAGALVGARGLHLFLNRSAYNFKIFAIWEGGIVFYGGLAGGLAAGLWFLWRRRAPVLAVCDILAPSLALGMVFGRIGCFLKGCCYGGVWYGPLSVTFPRIVEKVTRDGRVVDEVTGSPAYLDHYYAGRLAPGAPHSLPVHATQLYESAAMIALFFALSLYWRRRPRPGRVLAALGAGYGAWRFSLEFLRGDPHPGFAGLTFSQLVSLGVMAAAAALWALVPRATATEPPTTAG